jgi:transcriptional regulator with XRE-family HTH domain
MRRSPPKELILLKVGQQIRACRIRANLKQEDVEDFGVSWKHYQRIEAGTTNATIRVLYKLAKAFKCHPKDLLP